MSEFNKLLTAWREAKAALDSAKEVELTLRNALIEKHFKDEKQNSRTLHIDNGGKLTYTRAKSYKVHKDGLDDVLAELEEAEKAMLSWKPQLDTKVYNSMSAKSRKKLEGVLELKYGQPQLKFSEEKKDV